ncbi:MAG: hypothetical protein ABSD98_19305 [Candidatus Korobacteraceae bacterium]|jgi:hypothetical protein
MSSLWPSALASLDDALALPCETVEKLKAAKSVDIAEVIEQLEMAAKSAQNLRALVSSELPEASWQSREELDALLESIQKRAAARDFEQQQRRSRILALATELERGGIVQTGSPLPAVEYKADTYGELASNNPLFHGNTFTNVSISPARSEANLFPSGHLRATSWITAIGALIAAVAVLCFGISFQRQIGKLRTQLTQSSEAMTVAMQEGIRTDQRAWVGLTETAVHPLTANGGRFTIKLQNKGKTPALDLQIADVATIEDLNQSGQVQEPNVTTSAGALLPGAAYTTDVWFTTSPDALAALANDRLRAVNYLYVTYKDIFQRSHITKACFYWRKSLAKVELCDRYNELN